MTADHLAVRVVDDFKLWKRVGVGVANNRGVRVSSLAGLGML
jgi:hypothetical protein